MHARVLLPGLLSPTRKLADRPALPALETLLRQGRLDWHAGSSHEKVLAGCFGLPADDIPVAALRRLGERDEAAVDGCWLCADPVTLRFNREHLLLDDADDSGLSAAEAAALLEALNNHFLAIEKDFVRFEARSARRWYLRLKSRPQVDLAPLGAVLGRPVEGFLPSGEEAARWRRLINEAQVLMHNHPVNQAREAAGKPLVNSLWFWGSSTLPETLHAPAPVLRTDDRLALGCGRLAGMRCEGLSSRTPSRATLIVDTRLLRPALRVDVHGWHDGLRKLDAKCLQPLLAALKKRQLSSLHITAAGDRATLDLTIRPLDLLKIWRRPRPLEHILTHEA